MKNLTLIALIAFLATAAPLESQLINLSTRGVVGTGDDVMIAGFIIGGTEPKTVLIRARGPSLADFNVPGVLSNPLLTLFDVNGTRLANNDDWETTTTECQGSGLNCGAAAAIEATGLDPCQPINLPGHPPIPTRCFQESAILVTLPPGNYTAHVSGGTGVGLVEVFEVFPDIRGTYTGTGTVFLNNCTHLTEPSITVTIPQQTGAEFRGTAVLTGPVGNLLFRQSLFFNSEANHGTIGADGSVNGSYTFVLELDSGFGFEEINSGPGGFSGSLSGNTLNVTFITQTTSGGVCIGIVLLTVTRVDFCTTNADCQSEQFCAKDVGDCQGTGICTAKAEVCPSVFVPACGCDGITYSNSCNAAAAGVSLLHEGMCTP